MENNKLYENLLKADGIDPENITDSERNAFRQLLEEENRRFRRLSWISVGSLWIFVLALMTLIFSEPILDKFNIPFIAAFFAVVAAWWILYFVFLPNHNKKVKEAGRKVQWLYFLVNGKRKKGIVLVAQSDGKRVINWLNVMVVFVIIWLVVFFGGALVFYLLSKRWFPSSVPVFHILYSTLTAIVFVFTGIRVGFKTPLKQLVEIKQKCFSPVTLWQNIWRFIMKSRIIKLSAVTVTLIVIGVFINIMEKTTPVVWADVVKQLNNHERYKCHQKVVRKNGSNIPAMDIYHLNLSQRRQEVEDGSIHIIDMSHKDAVVLELFPDKNKAVVTKMLGFGPRKDPDIINMVKSYEDASTERLGTKKQDGKTLVGFRYKPNEYNDFTIWADSKTKLPVEIELKHFRNGKHLQTIFMDEFEFDFNLDPNAFSTEVPDGYEVETIINDYRPHEPKEVSIKDFTVKLNHSVYTVQKASWIKEIKDFEMVDPLGTKSVQYITGIKTIDGNLAILVQGNYYTQERMIWLPKQKLIIENSDDIKIYEHPNGAIYAERYLTSFAKAAPELFSMEDFGDERQTRMFAMPNGVVVGAVFNKPIDEEKLTLLANSLKEIKTLK